MVQKKNTYQTINSLTAKQLEVRVIAD